MDNIVFVPMLNIVVFEVIRTTLETKDSISNGDIAATIIERYPETFKNDHQLLQLKKRVSHCTAKMEKCKIIERKEVFTGQKKVPTKFIFKINQIV